MSSLGRTWALRVMRELAVSPSAKLAAVALGDRHNQKTGRCDPGHRRLANDVGVDPKTIRAALRQLEDAGAIRIERHRALPQGRGRKTDAYELLPLGAAPLDEASGAAGAEQPGESASCSREDQPGVSSDQPGDIPNQTGFSPPEPKRKGERTKGVPPKPPRQGRRGESLSTSRSGQERIERSEEPDFDRLAEHACLILDGGLATLHSETRNGNSWPRPKKPEILEALRRHRPSWELAELVAREARRIVQAQDRAPNIGGLYETQLAKHSTPEARRVRSEIAKSLHEADRTAGAAWGR